MTTQGAATDAGQQQAVTPARDAPAVDVPCNCCGSLDKKPFCPENGRGLVQCPHCGLVFVSPRKANEALFGIYTADYFCNHDSRAVGYSNYVKDEANIRKTFARRLGQLEKFCKTPGNVLDVGCAAGFFLSEAAKKGWNAHGIDISQFAVDFSNEKVGVSAERLSLLDAKFAAESFDLVTMWDVIEHVPDPMSHLRKSAYLLKKNGVLVLATPDVASIPSKLTGKKWVGYKLSEEHVYYFSKQTIYKMLDAAGFDVLDSRHIGKYVTLRLFFDRLGMYSRLLGGLGTGLARLCRIYERSLYVNPFDIIAVTARKR